MTTCVVWKCNKNWHNSMADSSIAGDSDMILPYSFEMDSLQSSSEEDSDNSDSQSSFTEQLDNTSWCFCANCMVMPHAIQCTYCWEFPESEKQKVLFAL